MKETPESNDFLIEDTVQNVLYRFDVDHAFPPGRPENKEDKPNGLFRRLLQWICKCGGLFRRNSSKSQHKQGALQEGCKGAEPVGGASVLSRSDRQDLWRRPKQGEACSDSDASS